MYLFVYMYNIDMLKDISWNKKMCVLRFMLIKDDTGWKIRQILWHFFLLCSKDFGQTNRMSALQIRSYGHIKQTNIQQLNAKTSSRTEWTLAKKKTSKHVM